MPTGRVKWYDAQKGYGFVTSDEGGDVFLPKTALPAGVTEVKQGQKIEFGVVEGRKGAQAMSVQVLDAPPSLTQARADAQRRSPDELNTLIEDMIKVLESKILPDLKRGRHPDRKMGQKIGEALHVVARELES
ncbi:CspA family cold shock protein [Allocatelliglobosispora scoriae]|uniref:CspA family cold shock protein n=1 Tax=Allocatelliglobosispora scoriae TaxID=643052 RepID=A0A841BW07_9ACTN|nr:cold shock domain-containing protein [Allocatelliglobosispora scoriae]MBB5871339.1 CspA family cold shock protein [Allocatelliglobosispora scoriae]